jgi:hypothetical protein
MSDDLITHPVWVSCHSVDYDEPWYDGTNEETFRPVIKASRRVQLIRDRKQIELSVGGHLNHQRRRLLVIRGQPDTNATAFQVYYRFSQERDGGRKEGK